MSDNNAKKRDYEIGYAKPPKHSQYKPGQSGNPKGRPSNNKPRAQAESSQNMIQRLLRKKIAIVQNGRRKWVTVQEAMIMQVIQEAAKKPAIAWKLFDIADLATPHEITRADIESVGKMSAEEATATYLRLVQKKYP